MNTKQIPSIDVEHIAKLARLPLTKDEEKLYTTQLSSIMTYVSKLNEVDTTSVEPTAQVTGIVNVFRDDEIDLTRILSREDALKNAPATYNGFIKVKSIVWN